MQWQALQQIPRGQTRSSQEIARAIGQPTAARVVGNACAGNPVAIAIPCHRVVRSDGCLAGYRGGWSGSNVCLRWNEREFECRIPVLSFSASTHLRSPKSKPISVSISQQSLRVFPRVPVSRQLNR
ncbi:MAG TPA: MGMT family protein [Nitrospiraceae bacterium]|nr:MGMT family protein [Nitrospiraceae bacterium]